MRCGIALSSLLALACKSHLPDPPHFYQGLLAPLLPDGARDRSTQRHASTYNTCVHTRRWGQHWLANQEIAQALVAMIGPRPGDLFLEIGPGRGRLTRALLAHPVTVTAVEIDAQCVHALRAIAPEERFHIIQGDILALDPGTLASREQIRLVGNLPYGIASPILHWTLEARDHLVDAHFMLPLAVARRVLSPAGGLERSLLSVWLQWEFRGSVLRRVGPGAFRPPPTIDSAFVRLVPHSPISCSASRQHRRRVIEGAFTHRRKTLANALALTYWSRDQVADACAVAGVDPTCRAQSLGVDAFARLAEALPNPGS